MAHAQANAVGPVRLCCEPKGLRVDLLRVGRFAAGFAPAGLCDAESFVVPYTAIRGMLRRGALLHLSLDPHAATPYNRFALTRFSHDPLASLLRAFQYRAAFIVFSRFMPLPIAALAVWQVGASVGPLGLAAIGIGAAWLSWRALEALGAWLTGGGLLSSRLCDRFEHAVSVRLGLTPAAALAGGPVSLPLWGPVTPAVLAEPPRRDHPTPAAAFGVTFRPRLFAAVAALALGMSLAAVHVVQRLGVQETVALPVREAAGGVMQPAGDQARAALDIAMPAHPLCSCERVASPLWPVAPPQLSVLIMPIDGEMDDVWLALGESYTPTLRRAERPRIEFDLAVVNNSTEPLDTVNLVVTFARRDDRGMRRALLERGLHWPAVLRPGEAVKWRVKASGRTELKVDSRHDARLGAGGIEAAPADTFASLEDARLPVVRLHGAMMLGYLRDARAEAHARALQGLTPPMEAARAQLLEAQAELGVCDVAVTPQGTELCVFNDSDEVLQGVVLGELGVARPKRHELRDVFPPHQGLRFSIDATQRTTGRGEPRFRVEPLP